MDEATLKALETLIDAKIQLALLKFVQGVRAESEARQVETARKLVLSALRQQHKD